MKKIVSVILALLLLCGVAYAITIDLSEYSDDELIELETAIQAEKIERGMGKTAKVFAGVYTIGVDIPAGTYAVGVLQGYRDTFTIRNEKGNVTEYYKIGTKDDYNKYLGKIELIDGYTIEFDSILELTVYSGGIVFE